MATPTFVQEIQKMDATQKFVAGALVSAAFLAVAAFVLANFG